MVVEKCVVRFQKQTHTPLASPIIYIRGHLSDQKVGGTQTRRLEGRANHFCNQGSRGLTWLFGVLIDVQKGQATESASRS